MPTNLDPSADFAQVTDGTQPVTLLRRGQTPGAAGTAVAHALRRAVSVAEAAESDGRYTAGDVTWHLPCGEAAPAPRLGDVILDGSGQRWTILEVRLTTLGSRWRCTARNLAVVYGLDDTIAILEAVYAKGEGGAAEATWRTWKTGIRARIQPLATNLTAQQGARQSVARCQIFVAEELDLGHQHRIQGPDGTVYRIVAISGAQRLGQLQTIEVEVTSW